jgi:uncharacterized damage-inducible protein DinB
MNRTFRPGAIGALMDEYERAAVELSRLISSLSDAEFERLRDTRTQDEDCRTIQTVMAHVIGAGYGYAYRIRTAMGEEATRPERRSFTRQEAVDAIPEMLRYSEETLEGKWKMTDEEIMAVRIDAPWGPTYDLEQLLEHAIVHVLRHRRQIERFLHDPVFATGHTA